MRLTPTARLLVVAVLLLVATALLWWLVGFPIGNALLGDAAAFRRAFGYGPLGFLRLFALAVALPFSLAAVGAAAAPSRWLVLTAMAFGAVLLHGDTSTADALAVALLVLVAAAVSESGGTSQIVVAAVGALVVAVAALWDLPLGTPQRVLALVVRALFYYVPLLLGPALLERHVLRRIAK
jgi:hypothetical protein